MTNEEAVFSPYDKFFQRHKQRLLDVMNRALSEHLEPSEIILVCIKSNEPPWKTVIDEALIARGIDPGPIPEPIFATALAVPDFIDAFAQLLPRIAHEATNGCPEGCVRVLMVLGEEVYFMNQDLVFDTSDLN